MKIKFEKPDTLVMRIEDFGKIDEEAFDEIPELLKEFRRTRKIVAKLIKNHLSGEVIKNE